MGENALEKMAEKHGEWHKRIAVGNSVEFIIGDPCYSITDKAWDKLCDSLKANNNWESYGDTDVLFHSTTHGDGCYEGEHLDYGVDSGTLGIVRADSDIVDKIAFEESLAKGYVFSYKPSEGTEAIELKFERGGFKFYEIKNEARADLFENIETNPNKED